MKEMEKKIEELKEANKELEKKVEGLQCSVLKSEAASQFLSNLVLQVVEPVKLKSLLGEAGQSQKGEEEVVAEKAVYTKMQMTNTQQLMDKEEEDATETAIEHSDKQSSA